MTGDRPRVRVGVSLEAVLIGFARTRLLFGDSNWVRSGMSSSPDCPFCAITAGAADADTVYADETVMAFLPLNPATRGHTLVVPRQHVGDFFDLREPIAQAVGRVIKIVARAVREAMEPAGMNLITSAGAAAQQSVFHLHVHVLPRYDGDRVGDIWPPDRPMGVSERESVRAQIASSARARADARDDSPTP